MTLLPRTRRGALWRFLLGAVVVIAFTATTTAVAGLLQFKQLASDIAQTPALKHAQVTIANPGNPQTLLLIGSDHRFGTPWSSANTDTMMLVRIDPNSSTINVLSVPRDLEVQLPGQGGGTFSAKLNSAYSLGGPNLLVRVLRQQVFQGLRVNHIIDVNFGGFEALVNALGCVYVDVDHRYYNNTAVTNYSSIDLQPGYQKLCGADALAFVRFRHTDSDIVRTARQQDFLRWVKDEFGSGYLLSNRDRLLRIFGQHTQTDPDLHSVDGLINLFNLVVFSAGHAVKQVPFPAILQPCGGVTVTPTGAVTGGTPCYVTAEQGAEQHAFAQLMTPTLPSPATSNSRAVHPGAGASRAGPPPRANLTLDVSDGHGQAAALHVGMPVYFPRLIATGSSYCSSQTANCPLEIASPGAYPRGYRIHDPSGNSYPAYRMTVVVNPILGEYYGIQGTTWQTPPILGSPSGTRTIAGKQLLEYYNGHKLSLVAWRTPQGTYWVSNTLTDNLSNAQMLGIAASLSRG